jgi:hypothetical protein
MSGTHLQAKYPDTFLLVAILFWIKKSKLLPALRHLVNNDELGIALFSLFVSY